MNASVPMQDAYIDHLIEDALSAMVAVMAVKQFPYDVRIKVAAAHTALHACRSSETVAAMEKQRGLR